MELQWTEPAKAFIECSNHLLCLGGPGSGKTTISILKAANEISNNSLRKGQRILFLSFARATVARVKEHTTSLLRSDQLETLEISTYHGFAWSILRSHGYLLSSSTPIQLLPPAESAAALSSIIGDEAKLAEKLRMFHEEGKVDFDLFARLTAELLKKSNRLRRTISLMYPVITLDEFQDTDAYEWELIKILGIDSRMIALADPEQRIYEFRGANPNRIHEFLDHFSPSKINFGSTNYRSSNTDICQYGNDLLTGANRVKQYDHVDIIRYPYCNAPLKHIELKKAVLHRLQEIDKDGEKPWSLAILVPTKKLMLEVSDFLAQKQQLPNTCLPSIENEALLDAEGPTLAALAIAEILSGGKDAVQLQHRIISRLCTHIRGRKGGARLSGQDLEMVSSLESYLNGASLRGKKRKALACECFAVATKRMALAMTGNPSKDWLLVRNILAISSSTELKNIASDAKFLKFLNRGSQLRSRLAEIWRNTNSYDGAVQAVDTALAEDYFSAILHEPSGVYVMTIHKSKGKQFAEVIIYEGQDRYRDRIVRDGASVQELHQKRLALRVAVTRSEKFATILTPVSFPCPLV